MSNHSHKFLVDKDAKFFSDCDDTNCIAVWRKALEHPTNALEFIKTLCKCRCRLTAGLEGLLNFTFDAHTKDTAYTIVELLFRHNVVLPSSILSYHGYGAICWCRLTSLALPVAAADSFVKLCIKYYVLHVVASKETLPSSSDNVVTYLNLDERYYTYHRSEYHYIHQCLQEIYYMRNTSIHYGSAPKTLFHYLMRHLGDLRIPNYRLTRPIDLIRYPVYSDVLVELLFRDHLLRQLYRTQIIGQGTRLSPDVIHHICSYLDNEDLHCMLSAAATTLR